MKIKNILGMNLIKFEKFIKKGYASGTYISYNQFINYFRPFLEQTLESKNIMFEIDAELENPVIGIKRIFEYFKRIESSNEIPIYTNGNVIVQFIREFVIDEHSFVYEYDAIKFAKQKISKDIYAKIIDNRFNKQKVRIIRWFFILNY